MAQDVTKNGVIHYTEFVAATLEARGNIEEEDLRTAFYDMDTDDSVSCKVVRVVTSVLLFY